MVSLPKAVLFVYLVLTFACARASVSSTDCCVCYVSSLFTVPENIYCLLS
jgi:hypothetical protein